MVNEVYPLSYPQASSLDKGQNAVLAFKLPEVAIEGVAGQYLFNYENSEPHYPVEEQPEKVPSIAADSAQKKHFYKNKVELSQFARFWHFVGDATHCSDLVPTPNLWYPGLQIEVENKYNYPAFTVFVKDIVLAQTADNSWVWVVTLSKEM